MSGSSSTYQPVPTENSSERLQSKTSEGPGRQTSEGNAWNNWPRSSPTLVPSWEGRNKRSSQLLLPHGHTHSKLDAVYDKATKTKNRLGRAIGVFKGISEPHPALQVLNMFWNMILENPLVLGAVTGSLLVCVFSNAVSSEIVDRAFFHSTGLLLAVFLSMRAKNAMTRRQTMMLGVMTMMNTARSLLEIVGTHRTKERQRLRAMLSFCFAEIATWVTDNPAALQSIEELQVEDREAAFCLRGKLALRTSPRALILYLREFCDKLIDLEYCEQDIDKVSAIRRWHRNVDQELAALTSGFDTLLLFKERYLTPQYYLMVKALMLLYVAAFPWCVMHESTFMLGVTTFAMAFVFFGLNHMTEQLEDPILKEGQGFNITLSFEKMFADIDEEEDVRERCRKFVSDKKLEGVEITEELHQQFMVTLTEAKLSHRTPRDSGEA